MAISFNELTRRILPVSNHTSSSISKYGKVFEDHPDVVLLLDKTGHSLYCNKALRTVLGYNETDMKTNLERFIYSNDKKRSIHYFNLALKGSSQNFQTRVFHKKGRVINIDTTFIPIMKDDTQVDYVLIIAMDITNLIQNNKHLNKSIYSLEFSQKIGGIGSWDYDMVEDESFWSKQMYEIFGIENPDDYIPTFESVIEMIHPDDRERFMSVFYEAINERKSYSIEYRIVRGDGSIILVIEKADIILDENKDPIRMIGTIQKKSKQKLKRKSLEIDEFAQLLDHLDNGVCSYDVETNKYTLISKGLEEITGYSREELQLEITWKYMIYSDDRATYYQEISQDVRNLHYRIVHKNGKIIWVKEKTIQVKDSEGIVTRIDRIITDITSKIEIQNQIEHLAHHDNLTDLPNRTLFERKINSLIRKCKDRAELFSIMYLDINHFRYINESLGHDAGDKMLRQIVERISSIMNQNYMFARIGGDEFGLVLWNYDDTEYPITIGKTITDTINEVFYINEHDLFISTSIGISNFPNDGQSLEELLNSAEGALYRAKHTNHGQYNIYSSCLDITAQKHQYLKRDLVHAIERNQLVVYFQPRVNALTGEIVNADAMIRWRHPVLGMVFPSDIIPAAEEIGFLHEIEDWMLEQVCHSISTWKTNNIPIVPISINITTSRFLKSEWLSKLLYKLKEYDVEPKYIELAMTEKTLNQHETAVNTAIQFLKGLGFKFALDDFGTGYSALSNLIHFSIDTIRLHESYIKQITREKNVEVIIKTLIDMANGLHMNLVAEGVETKEQLAFLLQIGCKEIQGHIFSRPVSKEKFQLLMNKQILQSN